MPMGLKKLKNSIKLALAIAVAIVFQGKWDAVDFLASACTCRKFQYGISCGHAIVVV